MSPHRRVDADDDTRAGAPLPDFPEGLGVGLFLVGKMLAALAPSPDPFRKGGRGIKGRFFSLY